MMPCYNARESLPWALASLLAQTFEDWELVLVDDGSTDDPEEIVEQANDPRIRLIRLPENRGRGHARQVALDNARGEYIAMLDADDWMYPVRIEQQVDVLSQELGLALVSAGMAIVDRANDLAGVRLTGDGLPHGPFRGVIPPVAHAPSMYRRSARGNLSFDPAMRLGEDQDFLLHLMQGQRYLILSDVLYVYAELGSVSARKSATAQRYSRATMLKHARSYPAQVARGVVESFAKQAVYSASSFLRIDGRIVGRRSRWPSRLERERFVLARERVKSEVNSRFTIQTNMSSSGEDRR